MSPPPEEKGPAVAAREAPSALEASEAPAGVKEIAPEVDLKETPKLETVVEEEGEEEDMVLMGTATFSAPPVEEERGKEDEEEKGKEEEAKEQAKEARELTLMDVQRELAEEEGEEEEGDYFNVSKSLKVPILPGKEGNRH